MKNIIIINGSPRKNGSTARILYKFKKQLLELRSYEIKFFHVADLSMKSCIGCCACYKKGHCIFEDDAEALSLEIGECDALILGTPTYSSNISGQLKTFIDRGHFVIEQLMKDKYAISVVTGENYGKGDAAKILKKLVNYSGGQLVGKIAHTLVFNANPLGDPKLRSKISRLSVKLDKSIQNKTNYFFQKIQHSLVFHVGIKPFVRKKGKEYEGVLRRWKAQNIV